jgi:hypothetical protein
MERKRRPSTGGQSIKLTEGQVALVRKLSLCQCTIAEIASVMEVTERTLYYWLRKADHPFTHAYHAARAEGKVLLRKLQFESANRGCVEMLKFLGKQYLGQTDQPQTVVNVSAEANAQAEMRTPAQIKEELVELQRAVFAEAHRLNGEN